MQISLQTVNRMINVWGVYTIISCIRILLGVPSLKKEPIVILTTSVNNFDVFPYINGVSEKNFRVLRRENVKVCYRPIHTSGHQFPKSKDKFSKEKSRTQRTRLVAETVNLLTSVKLEESLTPEFLNIKNLLRIFDSNSQISQHVYKHDHIVDFEDAKIVDRACKYHNRSFPGAFLSIFYPVAETIEC